MVRGGGRNNVILARGACMIFNYIVFLIHISKTGV